MVDEYAHDEDDQWQRPKPPWCSSHVKELRSAGWHRQCPQRRNHEAPRSIREKNPLKIICLELLQLEPQQICVWLIKGPLEGTGHCQKVRYGLTVLSIWQVSRCRLMDHLPHAVIDNSWGTSSRTIFISNRSSVG